MSQYPSLTPPSLVTTGSPTGQAAPTPTPTPATPSAPVVPQPVLPGYTTQQPGNLSPLPMPGIGVGSVSRVPQPGIGSLPAYQTPTAQAQRSTEQQPQMQIQYGPIGQAATSSSDLLKNLLAATQQSSPYDFTKNNPYLMENQPVQFFAEGGEVTPFAEWYASLTPEQLADPRSVTLPQRTTFANVDEMNRSLVFRDPKLADIAYDRNVILNIWPQIGQEIERKVHEKAQTGFAPYLENIVQQHANALEKQYVDKTVAKYEPLIQQALNAGPGDIYVSGLTTVRIDPNDDGTGVANARLAAEDHRRRLESKLTQIREYTVPREVKQFDTEIRGGDLFNTVHDAFYREVVDPYRQELVSQLPKTRTGVTDMNALRDLSRQQLDQYGLLDLYFGTVEQNNVIEANLAKRLGQLTEEERLKNAWGDDSVAAYYARLRDAAYNEAEASKRANQQQLNYLLSSDYDLTQGRGQLDPVYSKAYNEYLQQVSPSPLVPTGQAGPVPVAPTTPTTPTQTAPTTPSVPVPNLPQPVLPGYSTPTPQIPVSNLTPQTMPGVPSVPPPLIGGVPQPSLGIFGSQSALPAYQTQASSPTAQAQQPQQQIQYGPIGQGAVGQTNLLNTLLSNQQDPTKVSLLGFDNPYLMKPFG
jgi:hypothetical protein